MFIDSRGQSVVIDMVVLEGIYSDFLPLVEAVVSSSVFGCESKVTISDVQTGLAEEGKEPYGDRFKLVIPFAGQQISWSVVLDALNPHFPPDFCFDDPSFLSSTNPEFLEEHVPSLLNWNPENPNALLQVVEELLTLYRKHQVDQLKNYSRLQFEYTSVISQDGISEDDVEVLVQCKDRKQLDQEGPPPVHFSIRLPVDYTCLPPENDTSPDLGPKEALLYVTFPASNDIGLHPKIGGPLMSRFSPKLQLSCQLERSLYYPCLRVPCFPPGRCLVDYVPAVIELLDSEVKSVSNSFNLRKDFLAALLVEFGSSVLEYDALTFSKACILYDDGVLLCLVYVALPPKFPKDKPLYLWQSVRCLPYGKPYTCKVEDYPYSPRWSMTEMMYRLKVFMKEYAVDFFRQCS
ncbi:BRISC and BRCA1-A complex member 2-like [Ischnura elegans]|uniref:BRISC and BRCA1-A complex member 2-like n=1 Tax=Ischnura elegans TaxID=197161 RepID=UPI001ED877E5|nr:BRISC and BRCA1-A complex member 2-like [Ischnura elegans]